MEYRVASAAAPRSTNARQHTKKPIVSFVTQKQQTFYRVFSGDRTVGSFLTSVKPKNSAFVREALALPPGNQATFVQEVIVPAGTWLQRSRALPAFGRRGGAEQFELLEHIPIGNFGPIVAMNFSRLDPAIRGWVSRKRVPLSTQYQDSEVRSFELVGTVGRDVTSSTAQFSSQGGPHGLIEYAEPQTQHAKGRDGRSISSRWWPTLDSNQEPMDQERTS